MIFSGYADLIQESREKGEELWHYILLADANEKGISEEESMEMMNHLWEAMKMASDNYDGTRKSASGLSGGNGAKMKAYKEKCISGEFIGEVIAEAISMGESNACMRRIVAAPTAGSCGVLPAVLIPYCRKYQVPDQKVIEALYLTAGMGGVIATRASIAGAEGGCQAEIGSASAMAAAALVYLAGGTLEQTADAAALALKGLLGLVCDPIAGLVEVPCVKRNVIGAVNAITAVDMVMAGVTSFVPVDQVIDAMGEIGRNMLPMYRETGEGGLAATPAARKVKQQDFRKA
ncbi:MAG: L-serine ammonia-lyase, iron-sulfur-dependent, subunit alpha [Lachnospiraceae bacterium]|nr:L-serine ammonia-lyase, iron-sulfur-dependent, subunit alpha [Lachnospiraceae bacterium]